VVAGPETAATPVALIPKRRATISAQRVAAPLLRPGTTDLGPQLLALEEGQQYRFAFEMSACIGCHSCEVACAEQNNLPSDTVWRRVGEIEGGEFPNTRMLHMSMACNHCLDPACLEGCPTGAYVKLDNGIVDHHADDCIGCQYCTWNCPYSVPVFQPDRRIVTKCDMCKPRLEQGFTSACVDACPTQAISIEPVDVAEWRLDHGSADGPHLPDSDITVSTTRLVLPADIPASTHSTGDWALHPEHPHWPLVAVTLLTEVAIGVMAARLLTPDRGQSRTAGLIALATTLVGMNASVLHLGRPVMAIKAFRRIRQSWLSREAAAFAVLAVATAAATGMPSATTTSVALAVAVIAALTSARLYMVPGRPSWNTPLTMVGFVASGMATGAASFAIVADTLSVRWLAAAGIVISSIAQIANLLRLRADERLEFRGTWRLSTDRLRLPVAARFTLATAGLLFLAFGPAWPALTAIAFSEVLARWLFYVSVVPLSMPGAFFRGRI
jgi:DMSO reductase iron-sulfur subunit